MLWEAQRDLDKIKVGNMNTADRINYERAKVRLETLKEIFNKCTVSLSSN